MKKQKMQSAIPLTQENIHTVAAQNNISASDLYDKMVESKLDYIQEQRKIGAYSFFRKDEAWYDETIKEVERIALTLPDSLSTKNRTVKMYGWIANQFKDLNLSYPFESDREYMRANAVSIIFENVDSYRKMSNWD